MRKLIAILGPTASGKSSLGIQLAREFNGEIISADSRQVYRELNIGTGKVTPAEQTLARHHLLDVANPGESFSAAQFQALAFDAIRDIANRGKLPVLVGGTALYAYAVIDNYQFADVPENPKLRSELKVKTVGELQEMVPSGELNADDYQNPRRLIRAIEKIKAHTPIKPIKGPVLWDAFLIGIALSRDELYSRIDKRVDERVAHGMIDEVRTLRQQGIADEWFISLGLEYKYITEHLQGIWTQDAMAARLKAAIHAFARRQMTWFKRDKRIVWVRNAGEAETALHVFLKEKKAV